jgi:uncharacterized membrane protein
MRPHPDHSSLHPVHAVALAGTLPPFLGALLSDLAYRSSEHVQWANFAQWLLAGGLAFAAVPLVCSAVALFGPGRGSRAWLYFAVVLALCVLGFVDSLVHARDGWAMMPSGPVLTAIVLLLALVAIWLGFARRRVGGAP